MAVSRKHLKADLADERKATQTYKQRQTKGNGAMQAMYREMHGDEQDHQRRLSAALRALKQTK